MKKIGLLILVLVLIGGIGVTVWLVQRQQQLKSQAASSSSNQVFNVKDQGVKADGVSDDTPGIQQTIDLAKASGGGTIYFPPGNYRITSLNVTQTENLHFIGASQYAVNLVGTANTNTAIDLTGSSNIKFQQLTLRFLPGVNPQTAMMLANSSNKACNTITFDNFWVNANIESEGVWQKTGVYIFGCKNIVFQHATLVGRNTYQSILMATTTNDLGMSSAFTSMAGGSQPTGDISFLLSEIHNYNVSATAVIILSGVNNVKLLGGPFSSMTAPQFQLKNGVTDLAVYGTTMYTERDIKPNYQVWIADTTPVNGLKIDQSTCTNERANIGGVNNAHINNLYVNCTPHSESRAMFEFQGGGNPLYTLTNSFIVMQGLSLQSGGSIDGSNQVVY